jgi:23S rRNA (adenine1618-N6)-methyltransferase
LLIEQSIARLETIANECLPFPTSYSIQLPSSVSPAAAKDAINTHLAALDLTYNPATGIGEASQNVWKRAYRREFERKRRDGVADVHDASRTVELAFRVRVIELAREVEVQWLRGQDQVLWESFCGCVHRGFKKSG